MKNIDARNKNAKTAFTPPDRSDLTTAILTAEQYKALSEKDQDRYDARCNSLRVRRIVKLAKAVRLPKSAREEMLTGSRTLGWCWQALPLLEAMAERISVLEGKLAAAK